jgi:hypothetical protein
MLAKNILIAVNLTTRFCNNFAKEESILKSKYEMVNVTVYQELNRTMEIPLRHITIIIQLIKFNTLPEIVLR